MTASYGEVSVDDSNTKTKLNMNAFLSYLLSSIHFGQPMNLQPATSLKTHYINDFEIVCQEIQRPCYITYMYVVSM
jgi:hypothetical protein